MGESDLGLLIGQVRWRLPRRLPREREVRRAKGARKESEVGVGGEVEVGVGAGTADPVGVEQPATPGM